MSIAIHDYLDRVWAWCKALLGYDPRAARRHRRPTRYVVTQQGHPLYGEIVRIVGRDEPGIVTWSQRRISRCDNPIVRSMAGEFQVVDAGRLQPMEVWAC